MVRITSITTKKTKKMNFLKNPKLIFIAIITLTLFSCEEDEVETEKTCEDLSFDTQIVENQNSKDVEYKFEASEIIEEDAVVVYEWSIDGESIAIGTADEPQRIFNFKFEANGSFEVCVATETPDCPQGVKTCKTIKIEGLENDKPEIVGSTKCSDLRFEAEIIENQEPQNVKYMFEASEIVEKDAVIAYEWMIDGEFITMAGANESNRTINHLFENNGTFEVCVLVETPNCPKGVESCKMITVEGL